jgi:thioredoxin 1|tara:strand:- start:36 stop:404 length:369 start_codon:yes stop_codon:yes gene_type:complete
MKKILIFFFCIFSFSAVAMEKSTTFNKDIFTKAQSEGKIVVVSSWIKYCSSCASQMKILQNAEKDFKNIQYLAFDVKNKEISDLLNVKFQTTLLIFKDNKEVYRSIGEISKEKIYKAIESSI